MLDASGPCHPHDSFPPWNLKLGSTFNFHPSTSRRTDKCRLIVNEQLRQPRMDWTVASSDQILSQFDLDATTRDVRHSPVAGNVSRPFAAIARSALFQVRVHVSSGGAVMSNSISDSYFDLLKDSLF
jgi:hypothetical protein